MIIQVASKKEELTLGDMVVNEGNSAEPNTEDLADSADQETAKSMISLLLPQAIPLLKKASVRKPPKNDMSGTLSSRVNCSDNCKTSQLDDASGAAESLSIRTSCGDDENMQVAAPDSVQEFTSDVPIAPDSFDESHLDVPGSGHIISSSKEAYPADLSKKPIDEEQVEIVNANLSVSALDIVVIIKPSPHDVSTILEENNQDGCVKKTMSIPHCTSPTNRIITQESEELCAAEGNLMQKENHSENKEAKSTSCSTEGNDFFVGTTPTEITSIRKEKHKVYSRKRASTNQLRRNKTHPLKVKTVSEILEMMIPLATSLFAWHPVHNHSTIEDHVDMILAATKLWFSKGINNKTLVPAEVKDTAIWLLVSTDPDSDVKCRKIS